jgi:hypothetical protein
MTSPTSHFRAVLSLLCSAVLAGCASLDEDLPAHKPPEGRSNTVAAAALPDHSAALRCMDDLLLDYGTRDLSVVVEDMADPGRKAAASKYMLISAVTDMSKRSRAIRVVSQGPEPQAGAQRSLKPQYLLRGRISRPAERTLGLELMVLTAQDGTVSGTATRRGQRSDAADELVLRSLVDSAAIEVFGRLAKVPYWSCLGQSSDDPAVAAEIADWYDAMATRPKEIIEYFQGQFAFRGAYAGPVDGAVNAEFNDAVARYREALGLSREPRLTKQFMQAFLGADHRALKGKVAVAAPVAAAPAQLATAPVQAATAPVQAAAAPVQAATAPAQPAPAPGQVAAAPTQVGQQPATLAAHRPASELPLALRVGAANEARSFARGELVRLAIKPSRDAHVYCFLQDESRKISRFFPNRFQADSRVSAAAGLQLPGAMRFEIRMNAKGAQETVACFATERDVLPELPPSLAKADLAPLPVSSIEQVREEFRRVAGGRLGYEAFQMRPR